MIVAIALVAWLVGMASMWFLVKLGFVVIKK